MRHFSRYDAFDLNTAFRMQYDALRKTSTSLLEFAEDFSNFMQSSGGSASFSGDKEVVKYALFAGRLSK